MLPTSQRKREAAVMRVPSAAIDLPLGTDAPSRARSWLATLLTCWDRHEDRDTALLLVTELVTNAIRHGDGPPRLTVTGTDGRLRVAVGDRHPSRPELKAPAADDRDGRGLLLVAALASGWGVSDDPPGKLVWFELRQRPDG